MTGFVPIRTHQTDSGIDNDNKKKIVCTAMTLMILFFSNVKSEPPSGMKINAEICKPVIQNFAI